MAAVLGEDFAAGCMRHRRRRPRRCSFRGWISLPTFSRAQPDLTHWFVNGRAVRDRLLLNAVKLGYRDVLYGGRHPAYVLQLSIDPREVDVNAHPAKQELRFRDSRGVHDFILRAVERRLAQTRPGVQAQRGRHAAARCRLPAGRAGFDFARAQSAGSAATPWAVPRRDRTCGRAVTAAQPSLPR